MADDAENTVDLSFVPDAFKGEDGSYDTAGFRSRFDELATLNAQAEEAAALIPKEAAGYEFKIGEHAFPEGFNPASFQQPVLGEDGQPVMENGVAKTRDMEVNDLLDSNDPDVALLQTALHKHGAKPELMGELASIFANREVRSMMQAGETAAAEKAALGPDAASRIETVTRSLQARLTENQSSAILDSITSADGLRAVEELLKSSATGQPSPSPSKKPDMDNMSNKELIELGMKQQMAGG